MKRTTTPRQRTTEVIVKQDDQPVTVEVLAASIKAIAEGVKKLRAGPLNDKALILLIQHAAPQLKRGYQSVKVSTVDIRAVLEGMESLDKTYLKLKKAVR